MGRLLAIALAVAVAAAATSSASIAKEGVVARLVAPISQSAEPGAKVTVAWMLYHVEAGKRVPFPAEGVFIRFFGARDSRSARVYAIQPEPGRYRAAVRVPRGGVRRVAIGLMGVSCDVSGCRPSPALFEIVGRTFR